MAHTRKATTGQVALENCHPFRRELLGRSWAFAHNGHLEGFRPPRTFSFQPVGEDVSVDSAACTGPEDRVAVIATDPPTRDEAGAPQAA